MPVDSTHIPTHKSQLDEQTKEQIYRLIESGGSNNTIVAAIKSQYGVTITSAQVKQFREDRVQAILSLTENEELPRSAAERLIALFNSMTNVSFVYVKHNQNSGFVTYTVSKKDKTNLGKAINEDVQSWRKSLKLGDSEDILVSFAWCHDDEKRKMVMFPEYFGVDMTFGLNKEQRNLVTVAGIDGHNKAFIGFRCWMPSKQRVVYQWAIGVALPTLVSKKVTQRNRVVSCDGEGALIESIESTINAPDGPLRNSKFRQDYYHLVKQPWQKLMAAGSPATAEWKLLTKSIALWIKSFFDYVLTQAEYNISHIKLTDFIVNNSHVLGPMYVAGIKVIINQVNTNIFCVGNHHFTTRSTLGFLGSCMVEAMNPSVKGGDFAAKPSMALDTSSLQQLKQVDQRSHKDNVEMARQMNASNHWTRSRTNEFLTRYMEGIAIKNFDLGDTYYKCYVGLRTWFVSSKQVIDGYMSEVVNHSELKTSAHTKFDRVHVVKVDVEGIMNCSCLYPHAYLAPCRHMMTVLCKEEYLVPSLFHIRWWKQFNYYFGSSHGREMKSSMHDELASMHNILHEKAFDSNNIFKGCCILKSDFLKEERSIDSTSPIFHVMETMRKYTQEVEPLQKGYESFKSFKHYLATGEGHSEEMDEHGFENIFDDYTGGSDHSEGAMDIDADKMGAGTVAVGHLSQGSLGLERLVMKPQKAVAIGNDLYNSAMAVLGTIHTADQRKRFEELMTNEYSRNVAENNPQLKENDCGMQMLGSDFSVGKQTGKRHRMAFEKKLLKLLIQIRKW